MQIFSSVAIVASFMIMFPAEGSEENFPEGFHGIRVVTVEDDSTYLQTGITLRNFEKNTISFLAISPVNAALAPPKAAASQGYFAGIAHRPMTWSEANTGCSTLRIANQTWRLPSLFEVKQLNHFSSLSRTVLDTEDEQTAVIRKNWSSLPEFLGQYRFFWTNESAESTQPGLKIAGTFGKDAKSQSMSEAALLSYVCVTYIEGREREVDRMALPSHLKNNSFDEKARG